MSIDFLDCTLRDGAHVNSGNFGEQHIFTIIDGLTDANADIVEIGFLKQVSYKPDVTSFPLIEDAYRFLPENRGKTEYAIMARSDQYDVKNLSECNGKIKLVRIAFYYDYLKETLQYAKEVSKRGYQFTLNLINTPGNSLNDLDKLIECANEAGPEILTIVDTFGVLEGKNLSLIAERYTANLDKKIKIGLHVHENMSLGFSLAQRFIQEIGSRRDIVVDGSLMGIGRAPGNLCTELIADYLNESCGKNIQLSAIFDLIENDIKPIKKTHRWGYSPEFFISAKYRVHRSYAEYLSDRDISLKMIDFLISKIEPAYAAKFHQEYIDSLVKKYKGEQ